MKNPFSTFGYDGPEYFCDRVEETNRLTKLLENGNHVTLISPRRMGKTVLLKHCFSQERLRKDYYLFIIDIYATKSLSEFVYSLGRSILSVLKSKERKVWERFIQIAGSFRTGITLDEFGKPSWNLQVGDIKTPHVSLDEIFQYLSKADKPCFVAIDEFQSIVSYKEKNVEALLRTYIQECNNAMFVFSGSKRRMMGEMFSSPSRPFYQSSSTIFLKAIPLNSYKQFIKYHFENNGRLINDETIENLYSRFDGVTWYIQKICNEMFFNSDQGDVLTVEDVDRSIYISVKEKEDVYQDFFSRLSSNQKTLLTALAKSESEIHPMGGDFIKKANLSSASSVQRGLKSFEDKDIITVENGKYHIYDYFLLYWLRNNEYN